MKKLIITVVITAVSSLYFVIDAEKHLIFQGGGKPEETAVIQEKGEVMPLGTDLVRIASENLPGIVKQATESAKESLKDPEKGFASDAAVSSAIAGIKEEARPEKITEKASELISEAVSSLKNIITKPIEEKLDETFCSQ